MPPKKKDGEKKTKGKDKEEKKGKKDKEEKKGKKNKDDDAKGKKSKDKEETKGKKGKKGARETEAGEDGGKKKKKKKKIPKFEDIMADALPSGSQAELEQQAELTMEMTTTEPAEMPPDADEMTTNIPVQEEGAGFSAVRPKRSRTDRPTSSRPAAPRPKLKGVVDLDAEENAAAAAAQAAPQVMLDEEEDDDDDEHFVVEDKKIVADPGLAEMMKEEENLAEQAEEGEHGLLVTQILETKRSMEEEIKGKTSIEHAEGADKGKSRDKEKVKQEIATLRESIQKVTRSANPLGKMLEFLQEDIDSMQRELESWRTETREVTIEIQQEVATTNQQLAPLKAALSEYEDTIVEQMDKISAARACVLENEQRIFHLMVGVMKVAAMAQ